MTTEGCRACGGPIVQGPTGGRRKFCSSCRPSRIRPERRTEKPPPTPPTVSVRESVEVRLAEVGESDSWRGRLALALAENIDAGTSGGAGLAALSKSLRETLAEVEAEARPSGRLAELRLARTRQLG